MSSGHFATVIYRRRLRDLWHRTYWVVCPRCAFQLGPFPLGLARIARIDHDGRPCLEGSEDEQ